MKTWYMAFATTIVSILLIALFAIGLQNLPVYLKLIPWLLILKVFIGVIIFSILVDIVYVIFQYQANFLFIRDRWILLIISIGLFFTKFKNNMLVLGILLAVFIASNLFIGCNVAYQTISVNFNKAINYDKVRMTYQSNIDDLIKENTDLKMSIDKKDKIIQDKDDQLFLVDNLNQKLQVEIKRLLPKNAKNSFKKPLR